MKKQLILTLLLSDLLLASCSGGTGFNIGGLKSCSNGGVAPFGYVTYKCVNEEATYYSSVMSGTEHIYVFENADLKPNGEDYEQPADFRSACYSNCFMWIQFKKIYGAEDIDGQRYHLVDLESWYYIKVGVNKTRNSTYSEDKGVYLNGEKLTVKTDDDRVYDSELLVIYSFFDCGIKRSNVGGVIHTDVLNYIEYK